MKKKSSQICFILIFLILGCENSDEISLNKSFNIVLIIGQSNTHSGIGLDPLLDIGNSRIKQLGRFGDQNMQIIDATEPLHHHTRANNKIGFGLTFSKIYIKYFENDENDLLLIPCGYGGTGFVDKWWNKGDDLYLDAISRVNHIIEKYPQSTIRAILWHQGESDVGNENYQDDLDTFINDIRGEFLNDTIPFILGGMVPYWVGLKDSRKIQQEIILGTRERLSKIGYADPTFPFLIEKENNDLDAVHYNAEGQRELGQRYFEEYINVAEQ